MMKASHGGIYAAIFQGKNLAFEFNKIREDAKPNIQIVDSGNE
jgi:hypothetical protein